MNVIKRIGYTLALIIATVSVINCNSTKQSSADNAIILQEETPFKIDKIVYQEYKEESISGVEGYHLYIYLESNNQNIELKSIFFRGLSNSIKIDKSGLFSTVTNDSKDLIMSGNTSDEYGNTLPKSSFPFILKPNECVISYSQNNEKKYVKIAGLIDKSNDY